MMTIINNNRIAFFLLVFVLVGLLTVLAFAVITQGTSLAFIDPKTMRYCVSSGSVCTG